LINAGEVASKLSKSVLVIHSFERLALRVAYNIILVHAISEGHDRCLLVS